MDTINLEAQTSPEILQKFQSLVKVVPHRPLLQLPRFPFEIGRSLFSFASNSVQRTNWRHQECLAGKGKGELPPPPTFASSRGLHFLRSQLTFSRGVSLSVPFERQAAAAASKPRRQAQNALARSRGRERERGKRRTNKPDLSVRLGLQSQFVGEPEKNCVSDRD